MPQTATGPLSPSQLRDWYAVEPGRRWVRGNVIASLDGRAAGPDGTSASLNQGSAGDHAVFDHLRSWADVVVVGAGTVRAEGYPALPDVWMVVLSRSGDVPEAVRSGERVVVLEGEVAPAQVLRLCDERGWSDVLVEGGPSVLGQFLRAHALDELCVTVRPILVGGDARLLVERDVTLPTAPLGQVSHVLTWEGDTLLRVALR